MPIVQATEKYPAKEHALRTAQHLKNFVNRSDLQSELAESSLIFLSALKTRLWPYSDQTVPFRQDRYFYYLTGFDAPGAYVTYNIASDHLTLYLPPIDEDDVMWSGLPITLKQALATYDVDEVKYSTDLAGDLESLNSSHVISIHKSEEFDSVQALDALKDALDESRLIKDDFELSLMRKASEITDNSHLAVMSALPIETNEGHIHAEFVYHSMRQGSKFQAYDPICCSGTDCGTLHYVRNDQALDNKQLVLIDAGAEWKTYAADVTRVFPINGEWTKESRSIYDAVYDMQDQTMKRVAPGVSWDSLHELAHRILIEHFLKLGIFKSGSVDEILKARTSVGFFPHGLGHLLGMDTHDVGGKPNYEDADSMFRYLRLRRDLQNGMVVTVEPGIYFNKFLLSPYLSDESHLKYIDKEVLENYWAVGGVRIEDDVYVTGTGFENLTKITKDADEISKLVKDGLAKGREHFHVVV